MPKIPCDSKTNREALRHLRFPKIHVCSNPFGYAVVLPPCLIPQQCTGKGVPGVPRREGAEVVAPHSQPNFALAPTLPMDQSKAVEAEHHQTESCMAKIL